MTLETLRKLNRSEEFVQGAMYAYEQLTGHHLLPTSKNEAILNAMVLTVQDMGYRWDALWGRCRLRDFVDVRNTLLHYYRRVTNLPFQRIERDFGYTRGWNDIRHSCDQVDNLLTYDAVFRNQYETIINKIETNIEKMTLC